MNPIACNALSDQQRACLRLVWDRRSSKEIAIELGISKNTVDGYIAEAVARLGARDRREAARLCFDGNQPLSSPDRIGGDPARVAPLPSISMSAADRALDRSTEWRRWLPVRTGAHNDLHAIGRVLWIIGIAALLAIGFGAFASGVHLINDLFR